MSKFTNFSVECSKHEVTKDLVPYFKATVISDHVLIINWIGYTPNLADQNILQQLWYHLNGTIIEQYIIADNHLFQKG